MQPETIAIGVVWYVAFLFSTTCHESAHALAAKLGGDLTAFHGGQVTLNPWPHIRREPFGMVLVPIASYALAGWMMGWASAPYDPLWQQRFPRRAAWMALAGPVANFSIMLAAGIAIRAGIHFGYFRLPDEDTFNFAHLIVPTQASQGFPAALLSILFVLNLLLGTFNLLPFPPLDGNSVITLLMPERTGLGFLNWTRTSGFGLLGMLVAWVVYGKLFGYIFGIAVLALFHNVSLH